MSDSALVLEARAVTKNYQDAGTEVSVLHGVDFSLPSGGMTAIIGSSGSGKSTLLNILGGLDTPSSGQVLLNGVDLHTCSERERCRLRNQSLGFVYQFHHLLPEFTALENVAMPLLMRQQTRHSVEKQAREILQRVGLEHRLKHKPAQLSGGERQRVAIARSLIGKPDVVLMDEPTGNLDRATALDIQNLIDELNTQSDTAFILVTHDPELAQQTDKVYELIDGTLVSQS